MATITEAVQTKLTGTGAITAAFPGAFFQDEAPSTYGGDSAHYAYLEHGIVPPAHRAGNLQWSFGNKHVSLPLYQFKAYAIGAAAAEAAMTTLRGVMDTATLAVTDGTFLSIQRLTEPYLENMQKLVSGKPVYRCVAFYEIAVQH